MFLVGKGIPDHITSLPQTVLTHLHTRQYNSQKPFSMAKKNMKIQVDHMDSPERLEQLEKIDQLRELGVGEEINLPQVSIILEAFRSFCLFWY